MLYQLLKIPAQLALPLYCRRVKVSHQQLLQETGPLLLACNHPNSFLDAIILATLFRRPVYSLARGDAFRRPFFAWLLRQLNILPVYREREGTEHLHKNYHTFDACLHIFRRNGIVLIFSEALCENEWHLRPLRKGTARLARSAWDAGIPLRILPVGINYHSFTRFGKIVHLQFGELIPPPLPEDRPAAGNELNTVTAQLTAQLQQLVYEIPAADRAQRQRLFAPEGSGLQRWLLALPALLGWILHAPLYYPLKFMAAPLVKESGHYDSVMVGSLFLAYPFYLALLALCTAWGAGGGWWMLVPLLLPLLGRALIVWKNLRG